MKHMAILGSQLEILEGFTRIRMSEEKQTREALEPVECSGDERVQLRAMTSEMGVLQRANGSARVVQGQTAVLCAVYGPAEVKASRELYDRAVIEVTVTPESGLSGPRERLLEQLVTSCCEGAIQVHLHPHTALSITLQVERDAGALLSVLVHACCLGLLDACLPMTSVFAALTCGYTAGGELYTDPTPEQEQACVALLTFVMDSSFGNITTCHCQGATTTDQLQQAMSMAQEAAKSVSTFYRKAITRKLSKDAKFAHLNISV